MTIRSSPKKAAVRTMAGEALAHGGTGAGGGEPRRLGEDGHPPSAVRDGERARERPEGAAQHGALHPIQEQGVVDDADAAADVIDRAAGECAPGERRRDEPEGGPAVDRDRAVVQGGESALEPAAERLLGRRVDEQVRAERALQLLVRVGDRGVEPVDARGRK
mgnify:CR=1 FL=1